MFTTAYQQTAAEYRALCFQAFNLARIRIDDLPPASSIPYAIITDVDETVLDNSPYAAERSLKGLDYEPVSWFAWTDKAIADTLPGAGSLLKYAASKGISIFYITNRDKRERASTIQNLKRFGLPNADEEHLFTKEGISSKEDRRQRIFKTHEVVLFLGDNLADFSSLFDKAAIQARNKATDESMGEFGKKFIILPNPVYGDWEGAMYQYDYRINDMQKDSALKSLLKVY